MYVSVKYTINIIINIRRAFFKGSIAQIKMLVKAYFFNFNKQFKFFSLDERNDNDRIGIAPSFLYGQFIY